MYKKFEKNNVVNDNKIIKKTLYKNRNCSQ